jgi:hypothetical protein
MQPKKQLQINNICEIVNNYPTKYEHGFTSNEIQELLIDYNINHDLFFENMGLNTSMIIDGEFITYHSDIKKTLNKIIDKRDMYSWQFI